MNQTWQKDLAAAALRARKHAYAPYSGFLVGAALLVLNGTLYTGCNIENAAYSVCNCAERTALFSAVAAGERRFRAIAVAGGKREEQEPLSSYCPPCGVCRQALSEFCESRAFQVILVRSREDFQIFTLEELLPLRFGDQNFK